MKAGRIAALCARLRAPAFAGSIVALAGLAGCVNAGPGARTAALLPQEPTPGVATETETEQAIAAIETGSGPAKADVRIAAREALQARESGTISGSSAIDRLIEVHARENDIPPALAYAVVRVESRYNPKARGGSAMGLSQIKPATARSLGFAGPSSALYDADTNLTYGMKYLKGAWEKGGHDVCRTAMKYKGGHRATRMTSSALRYCSAVKAHMAEIVKRDRAPAVDPSGAETVVQAQASVKPATAAPEQVSGAEPTSSAPVATAQGVPTPTPSPQASATTLAVSSDRDPDPENGAKPLERRASDRTHEGRSST